MLNLILIVYCNFFPSNPQTKSNHIIKTSFLLPHRRYIKDIERLEIHKQSLSLTTQVMKDIFKKNSEKRNNAELLNLMIDIYKGYKKVLKQTNQKEIAFTALLVEVYKFYIAEKVTKFPENCNFLDHAIKMCLQEVQHRKNMEKQGITNLHVSQIPPATSDFGGILKNLPSAAATAVTLPTIPPQLPAATPSVKQTQQPVTPAPATASSQPPPPAKKSRSSAAKPPTPAALSSATNLASLMDPSALMMALCSNPGLFQSQYQSLANEYFKLMSAAGMKNLFSSSPSSVSLPKSVTTTASSTLTTSTSSAAASAAKMPQFDIKSLIESAVAKPPTAASPLQATTINIGGGELTITPTLSKPSTPKETPPPKPLSKPSTSTSPQSVSVTKVSGSSPSISVKPLSELSAKPAPMPQLPELPKSLSITPASSSVTPPKPSSKPQISVVPELGKIQKPNPPPTKSKSKSKSSYSNPYMRTPPGTSASSYPFMKTGFNLDNYASQAAALTAYADYIQSSGVNPAALELAKLQLQQMMAQPPVLKKVPVKKQAPKPKYQPPPAMLPSRGAPFIPPYNLLGQGLPAASLASMMPALSQAMAGTSASVSTPSTASSPAHQVSFAKTLQQKLAEKQKANQYFERPGSAGSSGSGGSGQRKNSDVIILD